MTAQLLIFVGSLLFLQATVFLIFRENSYIQVHDNLDLFASQLQIMKNTDTFFAHDVLLPMLGGVSRNNFGSEFSLYNILFYLLPNFWAYIVGYALKIGIGMMTRGEVALIVSQKGLSVGLLDPIYFTAVILLIIVSSISTPIMLKILYGKDKVPEEA